MDHPTRRALIAGAGAAVTGLAAHAPVKAQSQARPLVVGQVNLSFYTAAGAVILAVLDRLGHAASVVEAPHADIYARLGRGEADVLVAAWLPNAHGPLHGPLAADLVEAATLYEDALLYWSVPAHVPESAVASINDLKKPDVIARMDKDIVGVGPGSGLMRGSEAILRDYGLAEAGYRLSVAPPDRWAARLAEATRSGGWMVMPLWRPQYLNALYPVRILAEPRGIYGTDRAVLVVRRPVWNDLPSRSRTVIGRIALGIPAVTELERVIVVDRVAPAEAARRWIEANRPVVEGWFAA